jgi:hypothetical protein
MRLVVLMMVLSANQRAAAPRAAVAYCEVP